MVRVNNAISKVQRPYNTQKKVFMPRTGTANVWGNEQLEFE